MQCAKSKIACTVSVISLTWPGIAQAEGNEHQLTDSWRPVSTVYLDGMRGGFDAGAGLQISFGIEREGYVNGKLISATRFNIADFNRLSAVQADAVNTAVVPSGAGNVAPPAAALVIQNTLNLQHIRSLTVINATANSLELIRALNLQSTLADALAQSLRNR
jgi:hypothetical protein